MPPLLTDTSVDPIFAATSSSPDSRWGAASRYDFDNPAKWYTEKNVPLLDEHIMTDDNGKPVANVTKHDLELIARNNNQRVFQTGDPTTLILGHTSDDPKAEEKPAKGFAVNFKVLPFRRDPKTGKVIYAVHGDYKLRHKHAHLIEEFPRRSVELWWNKKELDPIAMLGGTTPERDLGVVMRMSRLKHIAMCGGTTPARYLGQTVSEFNDVQGALRFSRRGNSVVEMYQIEDDRPRKYRARPSQSNSGGLTMPAMPKRYALDTDADPQEEGMFPEGDDQGDIDTETDDMANDADAGLTDGADAEADPMVQKVMQSKPFKAMQSKLDMILQVLQGQMGGGGAGAAGAGAAPGMDDGMTPSPDDMGAGSPVGAGAAGPGDDGMGGNPQDMEERRDHGDQPVQFSQTGFAGPGSAAIPAFSGSGTTGKRYSRPKPSQPSNGSTAVSNPELIRMKRHNDALQKGMEELKLKFARQDAAAQITALEHEGIVFGDTPDEHAAGKAEETEFLALLSDEDREQQVHVIRTRYKRKRPDPANPANPGLARFSRTRGNDDPAKEGTEDDDFDPQTPQEASDYVACQTDRGMSKVEAIKYMRKRSGHK